MNPKVKSIILAFALAILLSWFTPIFGGFYDQYFGPVSSGFFWGPENPEYFEGFFMSYAFFVTLFIILFSTKNTYKNLGILLGILLIFDLMARDGVAFLVNFITALVAWLLAQIILFIYKKIKK